MAMAAKPQTPFPKVSNAGMTAIRFKVAPLDKELVQPDS
jgi:hypothetical protein